MTGGTCDRPGCSGTYEDGYCNVCGSPEPSAAAAAPSGTTAPGSARVSQRVSSRTSSSSRLASTAYGSARGTGGTRTRMLGSQRVRSQRLGAGITSVPSAPAVADPSGIVMTNPEVPEERRFCPNCQQPVGRSRNGRPGRPEGFCPNCRNPFSFTPKLRAGEMVAGQYEVVGCLAHGGLGWIYLARDRNVNDRWVVLKGLLNSGDPDALAAAIAERQFLAQVEHPLIVEIYNFVQHDQAGYIVMEYVGGSSLKGLLKDRMRANHGIYDPFPVDQAIAYVVEVLPAFQYLHDKGLLYCDFKPDNIIQVGDAVKLIDLGGVRRIDDDESAIYGTVGYQAPEVPEVGTSVESDVYTVGRTLLSLALEFRGNTSTYVATLPDPADTPLFQEHDSFYRLLLKACARNPADRFASADEMRGQLLGVLREVVAGRRGERAAQHSTASALFEAPMVENDVLDWRSLPGLRVDELDPQVAQLSSVGVTEPQQRLQALLQQPAPSVEWQLATAQAAVEAAEDETLARITQSILTTDPWEWRAIWMDGLGALARGSADQALGAFNAVYGQLPGELAPKLALALACEQGNQPDVAEQLYLTCLRTDANYTAPAAFGLARIREARGFDSADVGLAVGALDLVPVTSRSYVAARRRRAELLMEHGEGLHSLADALASVDSLVIDPRDRADLRMKVLKFALVEVEGGAVAPQLTIGGVRADEPSLRDGLEQAYRDLAVLAEDRAERIQLVDRANEVRRWTLR